jgi:hypothetical protein
MVNLEARCRSTQTPHEAKHDKSNGAVLQVVGSIPVAAGEAC